jgi:hypothetical protein
MSHIVALKCTHDDALTSNKKMGKIEEVSTQILRVLLEDFQTRELDAGALEDGYIGIPIVQLREKCFRYDNTTTSVDFDLALKKLERKKLVDTGPMQAHENPPGSILIVIGVFSKREYVYLTERGYQAAR